MIVVAAGRSERMRASGADDVRKPFLELGGETVIRRTVRALWSAPCVAELVVVGHTDDLDRHEAALAGLERPVEVVAGGSERADSVALGVAACSAETEVLAIHDGARPFVTAERVDAVCRAAQEHGGALLAVPARDTLKWSDDGLHAARTLDRSHVFAAHTPQAFRAAEFRAALERAAAEGLRPTDDAGLWERYHGPVVLVEDDPFNFKLTTPADLELARALAARLDPDHPASDSIPR